MRTLKISLLVFILTITISAQNFWKQTNGPYGGATVNNFLLYNDSTIFLATNEGLIKSSDNGESWNRNLNVTKIVSCISKDSVGTLYCGAKDVANNYYLLRSTDAGSNWFAINNTFWADIRYIMINYKDTIMLGTWDKGVYRTFNYGTTWNRVNNGNIYNAIHEIIQLADGSVLAGSDGGGVFKTTNWGELWIPSNNGIPNGGYIYAESFCETSPGCVFTGTYSGIYYSTNFGDSWVYKSTGCTNKVARCIVKDDSGTLYAGTRISSGVYYSTNNGDNWYYLGLGHSIYTVGWDSDSRLYAGGSGDGLYRFEVEDSSWVQVFNQGYVPVQVDGLILTKSGNLIAGTHSWGFQYSSDNGQVWSKINFQGYAHDFTTLNDSIFIVGGSSHAYISNDYGNTWTATGDFFAQALYSDQSEQSIYLGTDRSTNNICGIYKSIDLGQSWVLIYSFPLLTPYQRIIELYASEESGVILASIDYWVGAPVYLGYYYFHLSTDYGQTWNIIYSEEYDGVSSIVEDNLFNLYASADEKLLVSENEGRTWITREIPGSDRLASDQSGRIYRAYGWLYFSSDKGINWFLVDHSGLESGINDLVINQNNRIYLATDRGVYIGEADSITVSVEMINPTKTYYLSQNYPNPFNPSTKIKYSIPAVGTRDRVSVQIIIYDLLGREIATLVNEEKPAGVFEVEFNAATLPSGIYFYQLKAGSFVETKKMILIR